MKSVQQFPFINIRDVVMFPNMTQGLYIGRQPTIDAILKALSDGHKKVLTLSQRDVQTAKPNGLREMYSRGTICSVEGSVLLQDGTMKALLTGESVFQVESIFKKDDIQFASGARVSEIDQRGKIDSALKYNLLELLLRVKPYAALDEDASWFERLKKEGDSRRFLETLQVNLNYRGPSRRATLKKKRKFPKREILFINSRVKLHQRLLEEPKLEKKFKLIEKCLRFELENSVETQNVDRTK